MYAVLNSSKPERIGHHIADDIFKCNLVDEKFCSLIQIPMGFVPDCLWLLGLNGLIVGGIGVILNHIFFSIY